MKASHIFTASILFLSVGCTNGFDGTWLLTYDPNDVDLDGDCEDSDDDDDYEYIGDNHLVVLIDVIGQNAYVSMPSYDDDYYGYSQSKMIMVGTADKQNLNAQYEDGRESDSNDYKRENKYSISANITDAGISGKLKQEYEREERYSYDYYYEEESGGEIFTYECTSSMKFTGAKMNDDFLENRYNLR